MLTERELDHFLDSFLAIPGEEPASREISSEAEENLEEYQLPTDGLIIRQMEKDGKVGRRTWFALVLMLLIVPALLLSLIHI